MLDGSFFLYRRHFGRFLLVATVVSIPTLLAAAFTASMAADLVREAMERIFEAASKPGDPLAQLKENLAAQASIMPLSLMQSAFQAISRGGATAVMTVATVLAVNQRPMPVWTALLQRSAPRIGGAVVALLFQNLVLLSLAWCLPVFAVVAVVMAPMPVLVVLERGSAERALRARWDARRWLLLPVLPFAQALDSGVRAFVLSAHAPSLGRGTMFFFFVYTFVTLFVSGGAVAAWSIFGSDVVLYWLNYYLEVLFLPALGIATALWTLDLRARREGADLLSREVALA